MKRTAILRRAPAEARLTVPVFKPKTCKQCKERFTPTRAMQPVCAPPKPCAFEYGLKAANKSADARAKAERKADRAKREKLKKRGDWLREAKVAVQRARRLEELAKGRGCMSCGRSQHEVQGAEGWKPGGAWDGGHFISKGARPELALEPLNVWLQCKSCNGGSKHYARKGYTVGNAFEANLRAQEGDALVDWLKGPHEAKHYTVDDLKTIKATYTAKARELKGKE
jgi:hypothetical protein